MTIATHDVGCKGVGPIGKRCKLHPIRIVGAVEGAQTAR